MKLLWPLIVWILSMSISSISLNAQNPKPNNTLTIHVNGAKTYFGNVRVYLMAGEMGQPFASNMKDATGQTLVFEFANLPEENIGVYAFQDENDNFELDHDDKGLPTEPCAVKQIQINKGSQLLQVDLFIPEASKSALMDKAQTLSSDEKTPAKSDETTDKPRKERRKKN